jgi:peptidoglycan hydrolase CwlO-like protein
VILLVSAAVVGIVALTKTKGEARIRASYDNQRASRTDTHNRQILDIKNKPQTLQLEIADTQGRITSNNQRISTLNGQINGALSANPNCASDPTCSQRVVGWTQDIQNLMSNNQSLSNRIGQLNLEMAQWQNPEYVQARLTALQNDYQNDMNNLRVSEENDVALIPANKALARKLGIGAGIGAAIGTYLVIDGAKEGC